MTRSEVCIDIYYLDRSDHIRKDHTHAEASGTVGEVLKYALRWSGAPITCVLTPLNKPTVILPATMTVRELAGKFGTEPRLELILQES